MMPAANDKGTGGPLTQGLRKAVGFVGACSLGSMILVTLADVLGRNLFRPVPGASEIISFLLGVSLFAGLCLITLRQTHIVVGMFADRLPGPLRTAERWFTQVLMLLCVGLIAYMTLSQARMLWTSDYLTSYLEIRLAWVVYVMGALAVLAAVAAVLILPAPRWRGAPRAQQRVLNTEVKEVTS
jgi:TRAP-type C4-dicarboxylate transport system permease small subunit